MGSLLSSVPINLVKSNPSLFFPRAVVALLLLFGLSALRAASTEFSARRYLFLDPALLVSTQNVMVAINPPVRREVVLRPDQPWESLMFGFFSATLQESDRLRMWYMARDRKGSSRIAYAESKDGVNWTKPNLGLVTFEGSKANNLTTASSGLAPFLDPKAPPAERYAAISNIDFPNGGVGRYYSADGLDWKHDPAGFLRFPSDTLNVSFWDERLGKYVVYLRGWSPKYRNVKRLETDSLVRPAGIAPMGRGRSSGKKEDLRYLLDELPTVFASDEGDASRTDIYGMAAQPYPLDPTWYVAFPAFLRRNPASDGPGRHGHDRGPVESGFTGSRDGITWHRYDRTAYASPSLAAPDKRNMVFMSTGLVVMGDEIWQYANEFRSEHGDVAAREEMSDAGKRDGVIVRYVQRVDGFTALTAGNTPGTARTVPVRVTGDRLLLNLDTGALGEVQVGLRDENGQPLPGFALDDCAPLQNNATGLAVVWAKGDLATLKGRSVSLEFRMQRAKLFSFRFE